jgi:hypothetical protein
MLQSWRLWVFGIWWNVSAEPLPASAPDPASTSDPGAPGDPGDESSAPPHQETEESSGWRPRRKRRRWLPTPVRRIGKLLLAALVVEYLVLPQINGTRNTIHK